MTESIVSKCVKRLFGKAQTLCRFTFVEDNEYSANDYLDMAQKLNGLGIKLDSKKLKEMTKLAFIDDTEIEWKPPAEETSKEWTPEEKAELKRELESDEA